MDRVSEIRARCEAATPGPWEVHESGNTVKSHMVHAVNGGCITGGISPKTQNAAFIAASRTLVPKLCDALEAAQKEIERLNKSTATLGNMINQYADQARNAIDQQEHDRAFYEKSVSEYNARAEKAKAERDKAVSDMKYYLDTNEDNGVVYVPKFAVEQMISALTTKGE